MTLYYLDASVWVKRYYRETGTDWVTQLFASSQFLSCATLGYVEVRAALARKQRTSPEEAGVFDRTAGQVQEDWADFVRVALTDEVLDHAVDLADRFALHGADAVHLASALVLRQRMPASLERFAFVASDRELKTAATRLGLAVLDPEQEDSPNHISVGT
jgi:hypothetical protein